MSNPGIKGNNEIHHVWNILNKMDDLITHLRKDIGAVADPKAQALFETSAEVLEGLKKAFKDYEEMNEEAWK